MGVMGLPAAQFYPDEQDEGGWILWVGANPANKIVADDLAVCAKGVYLVGERGKRLRTADARRNPARHG